MSKREKHNESCRRSRRSYTFCKNAHQLEKSGGVEVFALVLDKKENVTYYASDELERRFKNNEPLVQHFNSEKCFKYSSDTFGIHVDEKHLQLVSKPTPEKSPWKTPSHVAPFIPGQAQREMLKNMPVIPSSKPTSTLDDFLMKKTAVL